MHIDSKFDHQMAPIDEEEEEKEEEEKWKKEKKKEEVVALELLQEKQQEEATCTRHSVVEPVSHPRHPNPGKTTTTCSA